MKRSAFSFPLLLFVLNVHSQKKEPTNYHLYFQHLVNYYNLEKWDSISATASTDFNKSVTPKKLADFMSGIKKDFGKINTTRYKYFDDRNSAVYHVELDKTWFNFVIKLDSNGQLARLVVLNPNYNEDLPMVTNKTKMVLPFGNEWYVFWGGDTENDNYHVANRAQKNAFDLMIVDSMKRSYRTTGKTTEDYYAFGQKLYSPCDGEIVSMIDGVIDNIPGVMNPAQLTGNSIIIKSSKNEYILMAHMKQNTVAVKLGQKIKTGDFVGLCGNSGNSSEPHLHLHIMDSPDLKTGTGIKCFFDKIIVNGVTRSHYSPVRGERIRKIVK